MLIVGGLDVSGVRAKKYRNRVSQRVISGLKENPEGFVSASAIRIIGIIRMADY